MWHLPGGWTFETTATIHDVDGFLASDVVWHTEATPFVVSPFSLPFLFGGFWDFHGRTSLGDGAGGVAAPSWTVGAGFRPIPLNIFGSA
ncbi:hypothetical protein POL68_13530 [Stigmatella sp. ncwal1]|uniref:Uncharacterized protein n=1 Tax=Stigmatella ashevillensis TaxID=2995309 RepID=A0ABT5DB11_9BACT|nr:hypothetical protein [Stigmatella ashevillena]MDC0709486.1 hypothetical protein [Stigmatella ashevillena]